MPLISDITKAVYGKAIFSKVDLAQSFNQLEVAKESQHTTTFAGPRNTKFELVGSPLTLFPEYLHLRIKMHVLCSRGGSYLVSGDAVCVLLHRVSRVLSVQLPRTRKELCLFLSLTGQFSHFIHFYTEIAALLE
jgi:hypothetical protein